MAILPRLTAAIRLLTTVGIPTPVMAEAFSRIRHLQGATFGIQTIGEGAQQQLTITTRGTARPIAAIKETLSTTSAALQPGADRWVKVILPLPLRETALTVVLVLVLTLPLLLGTPAAATALPHPLDQRLLAWPSWTLPAPLPRPGRRDLVWPAWFAGDWAASSENAEAEGEGEEGGALALRWHARFHADGRGGAVADRAFNARAIGRAALGDQLLSVSDDPANPNRQLTRLGGDRLLETTVVGRRSALLSDGSFLADELSLQVLHGQGEPRIQRVEVLGRWQLRPDGAIDGEQWQASYPSPAEGLAATGLRPRHLRLRLSPRPSGSDLSS